MPDFIQMFCKTRITGTLIGAIFLFFPLVSLQSNAHALAHVVGTYIPKHECLSNPDCWTQNQILLVTDEPENGGNDNKTNQHEDLTFEENEGTTIFTDDTDKLLYNCAFRAICPKNLSPEDAVFFLPEKDQIRFEKIDPLACKKMENYLFKDRASLGNRQATQLRAWARQAFLMEPENCANWIKQLGID